MKSTTTLQDRQRAENGKKNCNQQRFVRHLIITEFRAAAEVVVENKNRQGKNKTKQIEINNKNALPWKEKVEKGNTTDETTDGDF